MDVCSSLSIPGHPVTFLYARLGDSVTLQCFDPGKGSKILWYKQTAGQKPELISTIFKLADGVTFHNNFKENPRFTVPGGKGTIHLRISNIQPSDSAMYYCGGIDLYSLEFTTGIFLILTGSLKLQLFLLTIFTHLYVSIQCDNIILYLCGSRNQIYFPLSV
uniref:Ig-like domain-containing protein n=1 Tax=Esox lucius TaxID=8010 RepID=A0AAY5KAX7_ESOLU